MLDPKIWHSATKYAGFFVDGFHTVMTNWGAWAGSAGICL